MAREKPFPLRPGAVSALRAALEGVCMVDDLETERDKAFQVIMGAMLRHRSKAGHPNLRAFAQEISSLVVTAIGILNRPCEFADRAFPKGWKERNIVASKAIKELAWALAAMHQDERKHWVPPVATLTNWAGTKPNITTMDDGTVFDSGPPIPERKYYESVERWIEVTVEMAEIIKLRESLPRSSRQNRPEQIQFRVNLVTKAWNRHFDEEPKASDNSAFTTAVLTYYECIECRRPSHQAIKAALNLNRHR